MSKDQNWESYSYSKLVLQQLDIFENSIDSIRAEIQDIKEQIIKIKAKEDRLDELKTWKDKIDDVVSPSQMKYALKDLDELKTFKTCIHEKTSF